MLRVSESRVIDVTFQQIQKYEKGASSISASRSAILARMLQCSLDDFFVEGAYRAVAPRREVGATN
jgi:transcriptional regulator with XRE-family HTH domain